MVTRALRRAEATCVGRKGSVWPGPYSGPDVCVGIWRGTDISVPSYYGVTWNPREKSSMSQDACS